MATSDSTVLINYVQSILDKKHLFPTNLEEIYAIGPLVDLDHASKMTPNVKAILLFTGKETDMFTRFEALCEEEIVDGFCPDEKKIKPSEFFISQLAGGDNTPEMKEAAKVWLKGVRWQSCKLSQRNRPSLASWKGWPWENVYDCRVMKRAFSPPSGFVLGGCMESKEEFDNDYSIYHHFTKRTPPVLVYERGDTRTTIEDRLRRIEDSNAEKAAGTDKENNPAAEDCKSQATDAKIDNQPAPKRKEKKQKTSAKKKKTASKKRKPAKSWTFVG